MKKLLVATLIFCSLTSLAKEVTFNLLPFEASLTIKTDSVGVDPNTIEIQSASVVGRVQYCGLGGVGCPVGPNKEVSKDVTFVAANGVLNIELEENVTVRDTVILRKFSSCSMEVVVKGKTSNGDNYSGRSKVVYQKALEACNTPEDVFNEITDFFAQEKSIVLTKEYHR